MAFERPTLPKLIRRAKADIATKLPGADPNLRGSGEEVLAITTAGMTHGLHGHLKWLSKQVIADLADDEFLLRLASIYGITQTPAAKAAGPAGITGTNGSVCPDATVWQRTDGTRYVQQGDATISSGVATIQLEAESGGSAGNAEAGTSLSIVSPVAGINSTATVSGGGVTDGTDIETIEHVRTRLLLRLQNPPKGGGPGDYVNWALEVPGVTRAWEYANALGPGTVVVRFVLDDQVGTIIPDGAKVAEVQAYIDARAPITADVTVVAPVAVPLDITASIVPNTLAVKDAAEAQLLDLLTRVGEPGATILFSQLNEALSTADGETDHTITIPSGDTTYGANEIPILGTVTWS